MPFHSPQTYVALDALLDFVQYEPSFPLYRTECFAEPDTDQLTDPSLAIPSTAVAPRKDIVARTRADQKRFRAREKVCKLDAACPKYHAGRSSLDVRAKLPFRNATTPRITC